MKIAWDRNELNGQANFDIDEEFAKQQLNIFEDKKLTKIEEFKLKLKEHILNGRIKNNSEALEFTYNQGHIPKHASDCVKAMKKEKLITYSEPSPLINYEQVCKSKRTVIFKILN